MAPERAGTKRLEDDEARARHVAEERIPEGGLEALRRERHVAEERIPEGGLASLRQYPEGWLVEAVGLTKSYLGTLALNDVSLKLRKGEIFGLVGPNGAGKTTLLRILATLTPPDKGEARICGFPLPQVREIRAKIGFMPDVLGVYDDMLVKEYLDFFARASGIEETVREFSVEETLRQIGLDHVAEQPVDGLSRGMKQRLGLGRAVLHKPELLLLDEPASGLDPLARLELREILRRLQRQGATVVISSHVLEDLADMCDRIGVMSRGSLVCVEETTRLIRDRGVRRMRVRAHERADELFEFLKNRKGLAGVRWDNDCVVFQMEGASDAELSNLLKDVVNQGLPLVMFMEEEPTLESAYLNLTRAGEGWEVGL